MSKISIRFFKDIPVRAVWDEDKSSWFFSVLDVISAIRNETDYEKNRNYWKYLKSKLKKENSELVSLTTQLKLEANDGKKYKSDAIDMNGIKQLIAVFPGKVDVEFINWFINSDETIDDKSKQKAYDLFESELQQAIEVGTIKGLKQIHAYLFDGLYSFAGDIRTKNIAKGGFAFASVAYLDENLKIIEKLPEATFEQIISKYVEMNIAHPFMEGNGRATRIWLDMILKKNLSKCVDWSRIDKKDYLNAMKQSVVDSTWIMELLKNALTDEINSREMFMKGIDYSYYYEEMNN